VTARDGSGKFISKEAMIQRAVHEPAEPIGMNDNVPPRASRQPINRISASLIGWCLIFLAIAVAVALWMSVRG
jgi:hypothetical protein